MRSTHKTYQQVIDMMRKVKDRWFARQYYRFYLISIGLYIGLISVFTKGILSVPTFVMN